MKKNQELELIIDDIQFPNKGISYFDNKKITVKNSLPGQKLKVKIKKKRKNKIEAIILETIKKSPNEIIAPCCAFGSCGGCTYQNLSYNDQLKLKEKFVSNILQELNTNHIFEGIESSKAKFEYRNKMEFSFGDAYKDGPLTLGLHKRGSMYDIVDTSECLLVDNDYREILKSVLNYVTENEYSYYHKKNHQGLLRHLVVRKGIKTGEIIINFVTSSQSKIDQQLLLDTLMNLSLKGRIKGIIHTINDSLADIVQEDKCEILYGQKYIYDILFDLKFKITPYSFFQTNTEGAMQLYSIIKDFIGKDNHDLIYDLYCGTGTIAQIIAKNCKKVIGIELVEEAVIAAKENAKLNNLDNCEFIAGDVLELIDSLKETPDVIILDPPRDGIHPKAIHKIINFQPKKFIYVSCKPTSLARDLPFFIDAGYEIKRIKCMDMFPQTPHVETVVKLYRK
ncbi:MAG: 23S rRNA (uracil(1939)-C(5))-methyltransferase RlmD [Eubacteriaceae bacterium]